MIELRVLPVEGLGEVAPGTDLAALLMAGLSAGSAPSGVRLLEGDILVVASKIVAKAQGRYLRDAEGKALDQEAAVSSQTVRLVAHRRTPAGVARIVESTSGTVQAAAGVDASNLPSGAPPLGLPLRPDAAARELRTTLVSLGAPRIGVVITDTLGRAWRIGQTDAAIGAAGVVVHEDLAGRPDASGRPMQVTDRAIADELAAAADLIKGKTAGVPVAIVRGLDHYVTPDDGPGAATLARPLAQDWFRHGHVEAVHAALGCPDADPLPVTPQSWPDKLAGLLRVALDAGWTDGLTEVEPVVSAAGDSIVLRPQPGRRNDPATWMQVGALAERVRAAAWARDVSASIELDQHTHVVTVRLRTLPV